MFQVAGETAHENQSISDFTSSPTRDKLVALTTASP